MRVLLAGATGAVGTPLTRQLLDAGHEVIGLTRSPAGAGKLRAAGASAVVADAMDRDGLLHALDGERADAVIHQLTALRKPPTRIRDMATTNALRITGTANLLAAAKLLGARRFLTQSIVFGYGFSDHGDRLITETDPFGQPTPGPIGDVIAALASTEQQALGTAGIDGISLRYGLFYGPGQSIEALVGMLRKRMFPVVRNGGGFVSWIHLEDAASAAVAALEKGRGGTAYNVVDDEPVRWRDFLNEIATAYRVPRPITVPGWLIRPLSYVHTAMTTSIRASNAKARAELGWAPSVPTYRDGIRRMAHRAH